MSENNGKNSNEITIKIDTITNGVMVSVGANISFNMCMTSLIRSMVVLFDSYKYGSKEDKLKLLGILKSIVQSLIHKYTSSQKELIN